MTILFENIAVPEKGPVQVNVNVSFQIRVTAKEARREVNRWLLTEISTQIAADMPTLVLGQRVAWRVPVSLGLLGLKRATIIGTVDVDVSDGELINLPERRAELEERLAQLKPSAAQLRTGARSLPADYISSLNPQPKLANS